ncbi:glycosyl hydrolase, family 88 [Heterobasidion irregulare TC 32-1]|uniref:Glycosyl hydrolase, family 88 n=1 Tax=Heterobasidion irregulare (strain TC 32-1) TaxID=747525 RepID=W4K2I2_HETIT|nr:glycosyl hydrolase, family 88 [Heterobasidion irregulare TC 32-1]ETW79560.1 glycosyl hydrolase, family 88 [Heterobasidion irregulare TC 32-1]
MFLSAMPLHILLVSLCMTMISCARQNRRVEPSILSNDAIQNVRGHAEEMASTSWEYGVLMQGLLELEWPVLSVLTPGSIPPPSMLEYGEAADVINYATQVVANKSAGTLPLADGHGSTADPASLGVGVLLANWTRPNSSDISFAQAAADQLEFLLNVAPRGAHGVISSIDSEVQLVADFTYMVPPFIAYYGALKGGKEGNALIQDAYNQINLYHDGLYDANVSLWRHQANGTNPDSGHWATGEPVLKRTLSIHMVLTYIDIVGNAWAAAGMLRVMDTINNACDAEDFVLERNNLIHWIYEVLDGVWKQQGENGTLYNYIDNDLGLSDSSATALLAAVTYRMAIATGVPLYIDHANNATTLVFDSIDEDGWLLNTVAQFTLGGHTSSSSAQTFVLLLQSAYRDYRASLKV